MSSPTLLVEVSGEIDFDSRNPILVEDDGRRWRLEGAESLLVGDYVTLAATKQDFDTLVVRAVIDEQFAPFVRAERTRS
jgi:hypothetical protein